MQNIKIGTTGGTVHKAPKNYYCIGFSGKFYCLWSVQYQYGGELYGFYDKGHYMGRLSIDFEKAKQKAAERVGEFKIDLTRKGDKWVSSYGHIIKKEKPVYEPYQFPYGQLAGDDIRTATDVWQLFRLYNAFTNESRDNYPNAQFAKARLIELGELVEFNGEFIRAEYLAERKRTAKLETGIRGHHEANGARIELEVTLMGEFSFEGHFGRCHIQTFMDSNDRIFKYMGSAPVGIEKDDTVKIMATIAHSEYNDEDETKLKRIKIIK